VFVVQADNLSVHGNSFLAGLLCNCDCLLGCVESSGCAFRFAFFKCRLGTDLGVSKLEHQLGDKMIVVLNLFFDEFSPDSCFVCELIVVGAGAGGRGNAVLKFTENNFLVCPLASIFEWGGTTLKLGGLFSSAHDLIVPFYESCVSGFTGPHVIEAVTDINLFFLILNSGRRYRHLVFSSEFGSFVSRNKQLSFKVHNDIFGVANTDP